MIGFASRGFLGSGAGGADVAAPTVTIVSPTPGVAPGSPGGFSADWAVARVTPIVVDIDGDDLLYATLVARSPATTGELERVVYRRGAFRDGFALAGNAEQVTASKLRLSILPDAGWPSFAVVTAITFDVDAVAGGALSDGDASS